MRHANIATLFKKHSYPQLLAALAATVGAISDGMSYAWTSPIIPILQSAETPVIIQESDIVWIESIYLIGAICGLPMTIYAVNKYGCIPSILLAAIVNIIHWIIIAIASHIWMIYIGRFISGFTSNMSFVAAPMYIGELADQNIRGFLTSLIFIMMLLGILVVYAVAPFVSIPVSCAVGALFAIIQLVTLPLMPESPYYLILKEQCDKAKRALQYFRGTEDVNAEFNDIKLAVERQSLDTGKAIDLITIDSNRKALIIVTVLNAAQHFSSISVIFMNIHSIMSDASAIISANAVAILFASVLLLSAIIASRFIDNLGRKPLLILSSILSGLAVALLASYFAIKNAGINVNIYNWVPLVAMLIYAVSFKCGLGLIPIVLTAELFPTNLKTMGMTICDCMYMCCSCISIYFYIFLAPLYGIHVPFFIFSASCLATALFAIFYIPETKGKTLDEIQFILKGKPILKNINPDSSSNNQRL